MPYMKDDAQGIAVFVWLCILITLCAMDSCGKPQPTKSSSCYGTLICYDRGTDEEECQCTKSKSTYTHTETETDE